MNGEAFMYTASCEKIFFEAPHTALAGVIHLTDIAYHLSRINRFAGATLGRPYNVAQHSVLVYELVARDTPNRLIQSWALLHDAHEAYLGDTTRGLKLLLDGLKEIEHRFDRAVGLAFGLRDLSPAERIVVKAADSSLCRAEMKDLTHEETQEWWSMGPVARVPLIEPWSARHSEQEFLRVSEALGLPNI